VVGEAWSEWSADPACTQVESETPCRSEAGRSSSGPEWLLERATPQNPGMPHYWLKIQRHPSAFPPRSQNLSNMMLYNQANGPAQRQPRLPLYLVEHDALYSRYNVRCPQRLSVFCLSLTSLSLQITAKPAVPELSGDSHLKVRSQSDDYPPGALIARSTSCPLQARRPKNAPRPR
jgi:hypothetical protein